MDRNNAFRNQNIIQILGKSCSNSKDEDTLYKLRQLSTPYYNILKKPFFDLLQIQLSVNIKYNNCKYGEYGDNKYVCKNNIDLRKWDPTFAPRIRLLEFDVEDNENYCDITPSSIQNMNIHHLLFNQLFPYITTLKLLNIPRKLNTIKLLNFIQQFTNLKNVSLQIDHLHKQWLNNFKSVLSTLKASGLIVELRMKISYSYIELSEVDHKLLAPERGIINLIHHLGFDLPYLINKAQLRRLAQLISKYHTIIFDIKLKVYHFGIGRARVAPENILNHLRVISPFVSSLECPTFVYGIDFFTSTRWPNLISLKLNDYERQLQNLSIYCPKLRTMKIESKENEAFFSNAETTDEQALEHIFRGCVNSLKKLKIIHSTSTRTEGDKKLVHNNHLHQYLQNLLPHTKVEVE